MPPAEPALPSDYDFGRQAWFERLGGLGYTWTAAELDPGAARAPLDLRAWATIERLRQGIAQRVTAVLAGQTGAIAVALITGERGGITDATNNAFRDSGLLHVLSISGLHMAVMGEPCSISCGSCSPPSRSLRSPIRSRSGRPAPRCSERSPTF